jgi:hypothetical protein
MGINNNKRTNDDYGRHQDLILLFKIPRDTRKKFFEIYEQFGHAASERFASLGVVGVAAK